MIKVYHEEALNHLRLMTDNSVEAIITDPPYDLTYDRKRLIHTEFLRVAKGAVIVFAPPENQWVSTEQFCFWIKPISTKNTSKNYSRFVEIIHICRKGKWRSERQWSQYVNIFNDFVEGQIVHPHQKPLSLMSRLIRNHTDKGDTVLDPFMGSGTTGLAAFSLGREFIGIETDVKHVTSFSQRFFEEIGYNLSEEIEDEFF